MRLTTPILFLIFNRPEVTSQSWAAIREAKPSRLYIAADGPRSDIASDQSLCLAARKVSETIDWDCKEVRLYRDINLGCRDAVYGAIEWFFSQEEEGIILEDDILPCPSFFQFCESLLQRHRNNNQVMMITGTSYFFNRITAAEDYYFSAFATVWGWASWRRSWGKMILQPDEIDNDCIQKQLRHAEFSDFFTKTLEATLRGDLNSWAVRWAYSILTSSGLVARPFKNLVKNIGYSGTHAAHTKSRSIFFDMPFGELDTERIRHPERISLNYDYDKLTFDTILKSDKEESLRVSLFRSALNSARKLIRI